jgi:hypothetical protein
VIAIDPEHNLVLAPKLVPDGTALPLYGLRLIELVAVEEDGYLYRAEPFRRPLLETVRRPRQPGASSVEPHPQVAAREADDDFAVAVRGRGDRDGARP